MIKRALTLARSAHDSCFLWGPRQTGKTTLLGMLFPAARRYDLLLADEYRRLAQAPNLIREEIDAENLTGSNQKVPIIIDEVQKIPDLLDEIHWLIENRGLRFILCGSSARKLRRQPVNLLGGRAIRYELYPLVSQEIQDFSLERALNHGLLPRHYLSDSPGRLIQAYVGEYLREEIAAEALIRNIPAFARFLEVAALSNGQMVNFSNIARECGVSATTVKEYFQILEDTLVGRFLPAFNKRAKRRIIKAPRFYFFDVGVVAHLTHRGRVEPGSELFGRAFEHFIYMELQANAGYSDLRYPITYWRTASQIEIDFVLGDCEVALEVKATSSSGSHHLRGLRAFKEEHKAKHYILVSLDPKPRRTSDGIEILPWNVFLDRLWAQELVR